MNKIKKGDVVTFKPEYSRPADEGVTFRAADDEFNGCVNLIQEGTGMFFKPVASVMSESIATVNGVEFCA